VFSSIAFQEFDAHKYREFVQTLSDEALIREANAVAVRRREDRHDDAECVSRAVENLSGGMAQAASEMIGVHNCTDS
jgi:hypothetical protein